MKLDDLEKCVSGETVLLNRDYPEGLIYIHHNNKYFAGMYKDTKDYEYHSVNDLKYFKIKKPKIKIYSHVDHEGIIYDTLNENERHRGWERFPDADREL